MTFPGGAGFAPQGQPQGQPNGAGFPNQGAGLPQGQPGYVPPQQRFDGAPQQPQYQPPQQPVPQTHSMPSSDQIQLAPPYFPPPQQPQPQQQPAWPPPQQQPTGWPQPQTQPHQQPQPYSQQLYPQQQPPQQPAYPPQQPQRPQQQQAPSGQIQQDAYGRLYGPGLPAHLQGATMEQVRQAMGIGGQPQQQPQFRGLPTPQQPQQQTPTQQGQVQAQAQPKSFWSDPEGAIERIVEQRLAPLTQTSQVQAIQAAHDAVMQQFPEFTQYEADVIQRMQGLAPELLSSPQAWKLAFEQVVGERYLAQQRGSFRQPAGGQQNGSSQQQGWQPYNPQQQPQQQAPRLGDFFTESPSQGYQSPADGFTPPIQLTPQQMEAARRFGMSPQQYAQGMGVKL